MLFGLSSVAFFYGGWPFLKGLYDELKDKNPGMMTLIAVAIGVAYFYSSAVVFGLEGKMFFWELVTLIDIMLLGHWIEMKSVMGASRALELLVNMMPSEAHLVDGDSTRDIALKEVKPGDLLLVKPGEKIPADAIVTEGESHVNESMLTGESVPVKKGMDDKVIGGSINGNSSITIKVSHTGEESYLNKVITLVQEAQKTKSKTQNLANRAAKWLTYIALSVGFATLAVWLILGYDFVFALERMVTVMVISCPHALGLAVPLVVAISTSLSAQNGLLIRNRTAFENSRKITTLVFDKTGTLTKGEFGVTRFHSFIHEFNDEELLLWAAALEQNSEHPIAEGIVKKAAGLSKAIPKALDFKAITGKGIQANVHNKKVMVVSPRYLRDESIEAPEEAVGNAAETVVFVLIDGKLSGFIALADEVRPESKTAIKLFQDEGIKVMMATGDNEKVAKSVSEHLGLDGYYAEVLPHQKVEIVKKLQEQGQFVAMTGDGVNDAIAIVAADVGIAVARGADLATEVADVVLLKSGLSGISRAIRLSKWTRKIILQNIYWAFAYNITLIPIAAGCFGAIGLQIHPWMAAGAMACSSLLVVFNSLRLRRIAIV